MSVTIYVIVFLHDWAALSHIVTWRRSKQNTRKTVQKLSANLSLRMPCSKMTKVH